MIIELGSILIDVRGLDDLGVESLGRERFSAACIDAEGRGVRLTHDGQEVEFWESRFDHAFFSPRDSRFSDAKQVVDARRVARIPWICAVLAGHVPNSDCWEITQNLQKRFYRVVPKNYIIWLEKYRPERWTFSTAYVAPIAHLHARTKGAKRVWKFGQKNAP